jgi:L-aspartate oxidase
VTAFSLQDRKPCRLSQVIALETKTRRRADLVVVGAGVAGLVGALAAAAEGATVTVLSKASPTASNSYAAQGGVAAAIGDDDEPALHAADTIAAGRGLCRPSAVDVLTAEAPTRIAELVQLGVEFDEGLVREGGHRRARVVHAGGAETGRRIAEVLAARVRAEPRISFREHEAVDGLLLTRGRCVGIATQAGPVVAPATLLSTGGYAALWARTTNPRGAVGDGLLLAAAAGAALADLELVQFHPTAVLERSRGPASGPAFLDGFLLSEALRGAGALLVDENRQRFVDELAPRDVVARAIAARRRVRLDLRPVAREHYPGLIATLERAGYDPASEPVPVAPAAHYSIGGVVTDLAGRTDVPGLFAAGECACTGVHGANRLASNSLLECLVFGRRAALAALAGPARVPPGFGVAAPGREPPARPDGCTLERELGLIRSAAGLRRLLDAPHRLVRLIAESALVREESRGVHFRADFPQEDPSLNGHVVVRQGAPPELERWA